MKKVMRIFTAGLLSAALICTMSACQKKETEDKTTEPVETTTQGSETQMEGRLIRFSGKDMVIASNSDSKEYTFDVSGAQMNTQNMLAGDDIVLFYEGELSGTDTSGVKVDKVEDKGGAPTVQKEQTAIGTLVYIGENTITIRQNDGKQLTFNSNNCQHEFKNGLREGNWIVVTYLGEIQGTDTRNVKVVKITDNDENAVKKEQKAMNIKAVNETVYATAGVHIRKSYSTDSEVVGNLAKGGSILRTGVCDNGWSRVQYNNTDAFIYGEYLTTTAPAPDAPPAKTTGEPAATPQQGNDPAPVQKPQPDQPDEPDQPEQPEQPDQPDEPDQPEQPEQPDQPVQEVKTATGSVTEVSMNTISVEIEGAVYTFNVMDAQHNYKNGIQTGNAVTITYTGDLADMNSVVVSAVEDDDPNTAAQNAVYTGTVLDGTMNTITIQTDDGAELTFDKSNATDNTGGITAGIRVSVTADASSADTGSNIMPAAQIDLAQ